MEINSLQSKNLDEIWATLKSGGYTSVGPVYPQIDQDDEHGQTMTLPLDTPSGGNIHVGRLLEGEDWHIL